VAQVAALLKQWLRGRRTLTSEAALATARSLMQREPYAFLISHSSTAWLHTRLVQPLCDLATLDVWIGTRADLRKVHEVARNPYVTLAFQNNTQHASLVMYGIAEIKTEVALRERCWLDSWAMFFPDGPAASDYVLVRVIPLRLEVMSFRQKVVGEPFGLAPAVLVRRAGQWCLEGAAR
jgi:general stress protein 26